MKNKLCCKNCNKEITKGSKLGYCRSCAGKFKKPHNNKTCQCGNCKAIRGETKGINSPTYGKHWKLSAETIEKQRKSINSGKFKKGQIAWNKDKKLTKEQKKKISLIVKKLWKNKEYRSKMLEISNRPDVMRKKLMRHPVSHYEERIINFIKKYSLPYKFVGNGEIWIGNANPDFININGEKKVIEIYGKFQKIRNYGSILKYQKNRIKKYNKFGFKVAFLNNDDLFGEKWENRCLEKINILTKQSKEKV
jgi:hypothetical protein